MEVVKQTKKLYQILYLMVFVCLGLGSYSTAEADDLMGNSRPNIMDLAASMLPSRLNIDSYKAGIPVSPQRYLNEAKEQYTSKQAQDNLSKSVTTRDEDGSNESDEKYEDSPMHEFNKRDIVLSEDGTVAQVYTVRGLSSGTL